MRNLKLTVLFCGPSILSGFAVIAGAIVLLSFANFSYVLKSGVLYDFIFGKNSPVELIQTSHDTFSALSQTIFGNPVLNKVLFFVFWMMIGLFVYVTIVSIGQTIAETETDLASMHYVHARKKLLEQDLIVRLALRFGGLFAGIIYVWVFMRFLLPFCIAASRAGIDKIAHSSGWLYLVLATVVLILALHIAVIITRIITVRPRLWGSWDSLGFVKAR